MKKIFFLLVILIITPLLSLADSWLQKADHPGYPRAGTVGFVINGKGYIANGSSLQELWEYDPETDIWSQKADLPGDGRTSPAGFSIGTKGYVGTGASGFQFLNDFWEYDSDGNTWTQKTDFPGIKRSIAFAFSIDSVGYLGGGATNYAKEDFWEYNPATDVWTQKADYGGGKVGGAVAFIIDGKAYVGTGRDNLLAYRKDFWQYDPISNLWTQKADFAGHQRVSGVGFSINGSGYLGLGFAWDTTEKYYRDLWEYDPMTDSWNQKSDYPTDSGSGMSAIAINSKGYVGVGGWSGVQWWEYTPDSVIATDVINVSDNTCPLKVYPTVFSYSSTIMFSNEQNTPTTIRLFNSQGENVKILLDQNVESGNHMIQLNRQKLSAGIYFLEIKMNGESSTLKIIIQ